MRGATDTVNRVEADTRYRVYDGTRQVDELRFIAIKDNRYGFAVRSDYDEPERIDLREFREQYTLVPANGVPVESERRPTPRTNWKRY